MSDVLAEICAVKREFVAASKQHTPVSTLQARLADAPSPRGFFNAITATIARGDTALVAEIKRASPSRGLIREDFAPAAIAHAYAAAGATCLSVLTDEPYFQGKAEYLITAREACPLPVLRKDFMVDTYQVLEARTMGADCILVILAALEDAQAAEIEACALELGMDVLLEVHDAPEMERALCLQSRLLGINNRNLKTLNVSLDTTRQLAKNVPEGYTLVCESGIRTHADVAAMRDIGVHTFLVGESLMSQPDIAHATRLLLGAA